MSKRKPTRASDAIKAEISLVPQSSNGAESALEIRGRTGIGERRVATMLRQYLMQGILRSRRERRPSIDGAFRWVPVYWIEENE